MLKVGIIGLGSSVAARVQQWAALPHVVVQGYFPEVQDGDVSLNELPLYEDLDTLITDVDIVDICSDSEEQTQYIYKAIFFHKHLFLHNPFVIGIRDLQHIAKLIQEAKIKCQVGLYLRFEPEIQQFMLRHQEIRFLESAVTDKALPVQASSWIKTLSNHIDGMLYIMDSQVRRIYANGVKVHTDERDIVNVRIQFDNGAVGNVVINYCASRQAYVMALYGKTFSEEIVFPASGTEGPAFSASLQNTALEAFIYAIRQDSVIKVTIFDAINSVELTNEILKQIEA